MKPVAWLDATFGILVRCDKLTARRAHPIVIGVQHQLNDVFITEATGAVTMVLKLLRDGRVREVSSA